MKRLDFLFKYIKSGNILDIGNLNGQGRIHKLLINRMVGSNVYGLDVLNQCNLNINFKNQYCGSFENMNFENNFFDSIYMGQVFEHTWQPKKVLDECRRILKPEGVLILDTPNVYSLSRIMRYFFTGKDVILGNSDHKIFFSRAMMENILRQSGFKIKIISTERNFAVKGRLLPLPNIGSFVYMGECLIILAEK